MSFGQITFGMAFIGVGGMLGFNKFGPVDHPGLWWGSFALFAVRTILGLAEAALNPIEPQMPDFDSGDLGLSSHLPPDHPNVGQELSVRLAMSTGRMVIVNWNGSGYDVDLHGAEPPHWLGSDFRGVPINLVG